MLECICPCIIICNSYLCKEYALTLEVNLHTLDLGHAVITCERNVFSDLMWCIVSPLSRVSVIQGGVEM